jgi:phage terminase large subunit-like protein
MEFPELKQCAVEEYREWDPDSVIIEKKASGAPLVYELRAISRLIAVADIFASGRVWAPATRWAEEVIDEVAEFPASTNDDYTDTVSMALHRFRRGGYVSTNLDEPDEPVYFKSNRSRGYY